MSAGGILVVGKAGQLAQTLAASGTPDLYCAGRLDANLEKPETLTTLFAAHRPRLVVNAAAYTAVDQAETDRDKCRALNTDGPRALAALCAESGVPLIHISTDCVFDGALPRPLCEIDPTNPLNFYGLTKLEGERAVAETCAQHLVVRVAWVFSEYAHNFVRTMLTLAITRDEVTVVNDQIGYPTYCPDLARGLLHMGARCLEPGFEAWGVYHLSARDEIDRAGMAEAIFAESARMGGPTARVRPVATSDYPTPAKRALNARLDSSLAGKQFGISLPGWRIGLTRSVATIVKELSA
jgi:dTDP-4-dehydrorhamnose reductase